jgi:hypothetical protein
MDFSVELKIDINMNLHFRKVRKESLQENEGHICLWSDIALTRIMNVCMHSSPLLLIVYELICHSTQIR